MRIKFLREPHVRRAEMLRYAKCGDGVGVEKEAEQAQRLVDDLIRPAAAAVVFDIKRDGEKLFVADTELEGKSIKKLLAPCNKCVVMAITVGFELDMKIAALGSASPALSLLADAAASSAVEDACDACCESIESELGVKLTPRFSPGYGDLPMNIQPALLTLTNARRDLGLTVGSGCMLSPIKSVTAIAGIKEVKNDEF